jgi:hypothetical protein
MRAIAGRNPFCGIASLFAVVTLIATAPTCGRAADDHHAAYVELQAEYARTLVELAAEYERQGKITEARELRDLAAPYAERDPAAPPATHLPKPTGDEGLPADDVGRLQEIWQLREAYADELYILANRARRDSQIALAFDLVREVLVQNPEHSRTRRLLGYQIYEGEWTTPFEADKRRSGFVWHDAFGWIRNTDVARYEAGERPYLGNWISAEQEAGIRSDFQHAWIVESEHFIIRTNHSLERGVELSVMLEDFYRFFVGRFAAVFTTPQQIEAIFEGSDQATSTRQHEVHYFATRQEFVERLIRRQRGVENSTGLYMPSDRIAYFFHDEDAIERNNETLYHEATHQILGESASRIENVGIDNHFWVVEGIACYMESFRGDEGVIEVGDPLHPRMHWARERIVSEGFHVPLADFEQLGTQDFQSGDVPTLQRRYSQATGLTHFFLHFGDGIYRDAFIQYLSQIYSPNARLRARVESLSDLTGVRTEELDGQYQDYIRGLRGSDQN